MRPGEIERKLVDAGFRIVQEGRKHRVWEGPGGLRTITPHGTHNSRRAAPAVRSFLRKLEKVPS